MSIGLHVKETEIEALFAGIDSDGDGDVKLEELVTWYGQVDGKGAKEALSAAAVKVRNRMRLVMSSVNTPKKADEEIDVDITFSFDQSQIKGTRRVAALGREISHHFSEMSGPYRNLHNDSLGVLSEKQKHGFSTVDKLVYLCQNKVRAHTFTLCQVRLTASVGHSSLMPSR